MFLALKDLLFLTAGDASIPTMDDHVLAQILRRSRWRLSLLRIA